MLIDKVLQECNGRWTEVLAGLGIDTPKPNGKSPCPACGGKDRFHWMDKHGDGGWYCRGSDKGGDGVALVAYVSGCSQLDAAKKIAGSCGITDDYNPEEAKANQQRAAQLRKQREKAEAAEAEAGARIAREIWKQSEPAKDLQPYLKKKGIASHGARVLTSSHQNGEYTTFAKGTLVVPCCDFNDAGQAAVRSLEFISTEKKQGLHGAKRKGCFFPLGGSKVLLNATRIVVTEGFATAASIREQTGDAVVCCFTRVGIKPVADKMRKHFPEARILVAADNDISGDGQRDAANSGFPWVMPAFSDEEKQSGLSDWNDWATLGRTISLDAVEEFVPEEPSDEPSYEEYAEYAAGADVAHIAPPSIPDSYRILGYKDDCFYFMPKASQQVSSFTAAALTKNNLLSLAPLSHWTTSAGIGPDEKLKPEHWEMHINGIIQTAYSVGIFDPARIRGRGAWIDNGRNLLHVGNSIYVDGVSMAVDQVDSAYLYPKNIDMAVEYVKPASNKEANALYDICTRLSWERELSGALLAGWCVIAPLCGMVDWRPHIWVTGPSGSGKSTVINDIIGVMVGEIGISVEGNTSEAGIRQMLGNDARPVLFDEAEAEDEAASRRIKQILDFARVSSSGGKVIKGTSGQKAIEFVARSAFCFSSINTSIKEMADEARITKLILRRDQERGPEYFDQLESDIATIITPEFANKMIIRSVENLHIIQQNIKVFIRAASKVFKSRRIADQVGTLLAGTYFLHSAKVIDADTATDWIERQDWEEHTIMNAATDSERLLQRIITHRISVMVLDRKHELTVAESINAVCDPKSEWYKSSADFEAELNRYGIKVADGKLVIANNSEGMRSLLRNTPWVSSWSRSLSDIEGSTKTGKPVRFGKSGIVSRAVEIPLSVIGE